MKTPHAPMRRRGRGEDGTSLLIAMAFLGLLATTVVSMLTVTFGSFKTTEVTRGADAKLYGADGGTDVAIQLLRASNSYCPNVAAGTQAMPDQTINGRTVQLSCTTLSGSTGSGPSPSDYAFVVTGYPGPTGTPANLAGATTTNSAQKGELHFVGKAFNAGGFTFSGNGPQLFFDDTLEEYDGPSPYCTDAKAAAASSDNPHVTGGWTCVQPATFPVPDPLPTLKVPTAAAPARVTAGGCTTMFPGKYTSAPTFSSSGNYYLASGVYYFENTGAITLNGTVFGGQPGPGETQLFTGITPCSNDVAANALVPGSATGSGVQIVLGGNASIVTANSDSSKTELFARVPGNPSAEGTPGVSIYAPRTAGTGYLAWNAGTAVDQSVTKPQIVVHGLVYVPNSPINVLVVTNPAAGESAIFAGGLVAQVVTVKTTGHQTFTALPFAGIPLPATTRTVVVTATAIDPSGGVPVTVKAVVSLGTAAGTPATVQSWRKV